MARVSRRAPYRGLFVALTLLCSANESSAQQLSVRPYGIPDGLPSTTIRSIYQDKKGYIWFGTWEGLSRFDGYRFTNYGAREGLGHPIVNAIAEDRQGRLWVATNGAGVARLIDPAGDAASIRTRAPGQKFATLRVGESPDSNRVNALLFDTDDNLWCATDAGLYRAAPHPNGDLRFMAVVPIAPTAESMAAFADSRGRLWFGVAQHLIEVVDDHLIMYGAAEELGRRGVHSVVEDPQGRVFAANDYGVFEFIEPADARGRGRWKKVPVSLKPSERFSTMLMDSSGALWLGTSHGLIKYKDGQPIWFTTAQGLSVNNVTALSEDRDGNLWIGTQGGAACKLAGELIVSFTSKEGLPEAPVVKIIEDRQGRIYASTDAKGLVEIVDGRAVPVEGSHAPPFNTIADRILQDRRGDWWIGTGQGVFRFEGPGLQLRRGVKFKTTDGIPETNVVQMIADLEGRVWIRPSGGDLYRFDPTRPGRAVFERIPLEGTSSFAGVMDILGDRSGTLWLGSMALLGRLTHERIVMLQPTKGLPETNPRAFFQDSRGWLWIGLRYGGVSMTKDPTAARLEFINYSTANGLTSDAVWSIAEDEDGRIYLGTSRGLDRLDPATGRVRHFTTADGLAGDAIGHCLKDRQGNIWVATTTGLSKLNPRALRAVSRPPPIYLSRVTVAGEDVPLAETGATQGPTLELPASRNNVLLEYVGLDFRGERPLKYQYRLDASDSHWSPPTEQRTITYARLAPGSYRFLVRAVNQEDMVSPEPAVIAFSILAPVWQRWWFLTLAALAAGSAIYAVYRSRMARLLEVANIRTRIATDLHDDIGANLTKIGILSEVARQQIGNGDTRTDDALSSIARISRDSVASMGDIVWAINPERDSVRDLVRRMRRHADEVFASRDVELRFTAPDEEHVVKLGADVRRDIYLILKEAVNNAARHSGCAKVEIDVRAEGSRVSLRIADDGVGFELSRDSEGNGLASMRRRASRMGATLDVDSRPGRGTDVRLSVHRAHPAPRASRREAPPT